MPTSTSFPSTTSNDTFFGDMKTDNGVTDRIRDGQSPIFSSFNSLSIPAGATINGIEVIMEGHEGTSQTDFDGPSGDNLNWVYVSNDGGSSFNGGPLQTGGTWSNSSGAPSVEVAPASGGSTELWGLSWNATTAANIQVQLAWPGSPSVAVFLDYVQVKVYYTEPGPSTYNNSSDEQIISKNTIFVSNGLIEF